MKTIFEQGSFEKYSYVRLDESMGTILAHSQYGATKKTTVFISHKHEDLADLKGILGFLENSYGVKVYIDSQDPTMPKLTSAKTAINIKERIRKCDKFILLATNNAIDSKWCNWELGYGDAQKYQDNIALFPMKPKGAFDNEYRGTEYMAIYPYIAFYDGTEKYLDGTPIMRGYYVREKRDNTNYIIPLNEWLKR